MFSLNDKMTYKRKLMDTCIKKNKKQVNEEVQLELNSQ